MAVCKLDNFHVLRTLGRGSHGKVKLVEDESGNRFAAKIISLWQIQENFRYAEILKNEVESLSRLNHPNIVKIFSFSFSAQYTNKKGITREVAYVLMDYCENGTLLSFIYKNGHFSEPIARFYFRQLVSAIEHCHSAGVFHRDLKPDNILLENNGNLKICDFGLSNVTTKKLEIELLTSPVGTLRYMAPEMLLGQAYQGDKADIFALSVVLFIMRSAHPPFIRAMKNDPNYRALLDNPQKFWRAFGRNKPEGHYSVPFKRLVKKMMSFSPEHRISIAKIKRTKWFNGETKSPIASFCEDQGIMEIDNKSGGGDIQSLCGEQENEKVSSIMSQNVEMKNKEIIDFRVVNFSKVQTAFDFCQISKAVINFIQ
jgi:serine/threonine protein kinase